MGKEGHWRSSVGGNHNSRHALLEEAEASGCLVGSLMVREGPIRVWTSVAGWLARVWEGAGQPMIMAEAWEGAVTDKFKSRPLLKNHTHCRSLILTSERFLRSEIYDSVVKVVSFYQHMNYTMRCHISQEHKDIALHMLLNENVSNKNI